MAAQQFKERVVSGSKTSGNEMREAANLIAELTAVVEDLDSRISRLTARVASLENTEQSSD
jgi:hypothetical protein